MYSLKLVGNSRDMGKAANLVAGVLLARKETWMERPNLVKFLER